MRFERLGNIVTIAKGKKPAFSESPNEYSLRVLQIDDLRNDNNIKYTDDKTGVFAKEEDVLIAWDGANAGTIGFGKTGYIGSTIAVLRKNNSIDFDTVFIGKFLQSQSEFLRGKSTGATIPHIDRKSLESLRIPFLPISDQLLIATILTKAENLISQRKQSIALLDEFLKSTFLEMFGDPVRNDKGWRKVALSTLITGIESGWSPVCLNRPRSHELEWAVLKLSSVTYRRFNPQENKLLDQSTTIQREKVPKRGDLLFSRKNTSELVGAAAFVFEDCERLLLPDTIFRINYENNKIHGLYFWYLFNNLTFRKVIQSLASGAAGSMPNISKEKLNKLKIPIPPLELQSQFAQIVEKTEALKTQYQSSLHELEKLYGSLSQRAFRGELNIEVQ